MCSYGESCTHCTQKTSNLVPVSTADVKQTRVKEDKRRNKNFHCNQRSPNLQNPFE